MYTRHNEVRQLFDEAIAKFIKSGDLQFRDRQIFEEVLGDTLEMREMFFVFLHDVSTCPPEVIKWLQEQINAAAK